MGAMSTAFGVGVVYSFKDLAAHQIDLAQAKLKGFQAQNAAMGVYASRASAGLAQMASALRPMAIGGAMVAGPMMLAKSYGEFEESILRVGQVARASKEDMEKLEAEASRVGMTTSMSAAEAAKGMYELASAGFSTDEVIESMSKTVNFAKVSGLQFGEAADAVTATLRAFGYEAKDTATVTDKMVALQQVSKFHFNEMGGAMGSVAGTANAMNQNLDTTCAWLGNLRNQGLTAQNSAFKLKMTLTSLVAPKSVGLMKELGVNVTDSEGKYRNLTDIMVDLSGATNKYSDAQKAAISRHLFGARNMDIIARFNKASYTAIRDGKTVVMQGAEAYKGMAEDAKNSTGVTAKQAKELSETINSQFGQAKAKVTALKDALGKQWAPVMVDSLKKLNKNMTAMVQWVETHPKAVKAIFQVVSSLGKLLLLYGSIKMALGALKLLWGIPMAAIKAYQTTVTIMKTMQALAKSEQMIKFLQFMRGGSGMLQMPGPGTGPAAWTGFFKNFSVNAQNSRAMGVGLFSSLRAGLNLSSGALGATNLKFGTIASTIKGMPPLQGGLAAGVIAASAAAVTTAVVLWVQWRKEIQATNAALALAREEEERRAKSYAQKRGLGDEFAKAPTEVKTAYAAAEASVKRDIGKGNIKTEEEVASAFKERMKKSLEQSVEVQMGPKASREEKEKEVAKLMAQYNEQAMEKIVTSIRDEFQLQVDVNIDGEKIADASVKAEQNKKVSAGQAPGRARQETNSSPATSKSRGY